LSRILLDLGCLRWPRYSELTEKAKSGQKRPAERTYETDHYLVSRRRHPSPWMTICQQAKRVARRAGGDKRFPSCERCRQGATATLTARSYMYSRIKRSVPPLQPHPFRGGTLVLMTYHIIGIVHDWGEESWTVAESSHPRSGVTRPVFMDLSTRSGPFGVRAISFEPMRVSDEVGVPCRY